MSFEDHEYEHIQADHIAGLIQDALCHDEAERESILSRDRKSVLHSIANLIDDIPGFNRPDDDELLIALSNRTVPSGYPQNEMVRAGVGVIVAYDSRDFTALRNYLGILDALSVEQLKIIRPESVWPDERHSIRELQGRGGDSLPREEIEHGFGLIRSNVDGARERNAQTALELLTGPVRGEIAHWLSIIVRGRLPEHRVVSREETALQAKEKRQDAEADPILLLACALMDLYDESVADSAKWLVFHERLDEFESLLTKNV